jgi:LPS O-antigen subunit length determinant protein (WzzB/FepE family)
MKKNNSYLADDEIDLRDIIKSLWREKILILSISIICGLAGYLYASFQPQIFKTKIIFKDPPRELFTPYSNLIKEAKTFQDFISNFKLNFFSSNNLHSFVEESREFDNFKGYLKSRNITVQKYFQNKINQEIEKNKIIENSFSLVFTKELDGDIFLNNYAYFIKKKTVAEIKKNLKLSIETLITIHENAYEAAILINLQDPLIKLYSQSIIIAQQSDLLYRGSKMLLQDIGNLKKVLIKLENDPFDFELVLDKQLKSPVKANSNLLHFVSGIIFGFFLSLLIIYFKSIFKK